MREAVYPVPQGAPAPGVPSRLLVGRADPIVSKPASVLQGKTQDLLTVRQPLLFKFVAPAPVVLTSNVILQGRAQDFFAVRPPFLVPLQAPAVVLPLPFFLMVPPTRRIEDGTVRRPALTQFLPVTVVVAGRLIYIPTFRPRRR